MAKEVKVLVACGSGVATSTIAQEEIKDIAKNAGVKIRLMKGTISEFTSNSYCIIISSQTS